jgi:hypothetical protein
MKYLKKGTKWNIMYLLHSLEYLTSIQWEISIIYDLTYSLRPIIQEYIGCNNILYYGTDGVVYNII